MNALGKKDWFALGATVLSAVAVFYTFFVPFLIEQKKVPLRDSCFLLALLLIAAIVFSVLQQIESAKEDRKRIRAQARRDTKISKILRETNGQMRAQRAPLERSDAVMFASELYGDLSNFEEVISQRSLGIGIIFGVKQTDLLTVDSLPRHYLTAVAALPDYRPPITVENAVRARPKSLNDIRVIAEFLGSFGMAESTVTLSFADVLELTRNEI